MTRTSIISSSLVEQSEKWLLNYFFSARESENKLNCPIIKLSDILIERHAGLDPQKFPDWEFPYLGLENIESNTGFLVGFEKKLGLDVKSRCKVFRGGDILYGKLRPTLNKILIVDEAIEGGICSTEIFVMILNRKKMLPYFLKFLLSTESVLEQVRSYTAGAALPRIHIDDFLKIEVPLPKMEIVEKMEKDLKDLHFKMLQSKFQLTQMPQLWEMAYECIFLEGGTPTISLETSRSIAPGIEGELPPSFKESQTLFVIQDLFSNAPK